MKRSRLAVTAMYLCTLASPAYVLAAPSENKQTKKTSPLSAAQRQKAEKAIDAGLKFLAQRQQADGSWPSDFGPAVTAICARSFTNDDDYGANHDVVKKSLQSIMTFQQPDGGIYERANNLANYQTCVALLLFVDLNDSSYRPQMLRAQKFLSELQYGANESVDEVNPWYGGAGYNQTKRPDISNTQMMLEALKASGLPSSHPVYQRALKFVSRCQLNDATNDLPLADGRNEGGFIYSTNNSGESKASEKINEGQGPLRCYGSVTYAGFKSMLYADVKRDDPRITACLKWIRNNYTLKSNPNMPGKQAREGLYYYYHVFAKALSVWGEDMLVDAKGKEHNWRLDLINELIERQAKDGSWVNDTTRWLEGDPHYVTALAIQSLQAALEE